MKLSRKFFCQVKAHLPLNPFENVSRLGIDEIAHRKGRNSYHLILYDLDSGHPLDVLENRTQKQLCQYLQGLPQTLRDSIKEVCIDMWRPYALAIKEQLPNARLMIDRFHVMKSVTSELKSLKNKEKKQLPKEAQGCHYAILKNQDRLTAKQQEILDQVYQHSKPLKRAHQFKEQFRAIFQENLNIYQARKKLQKWICKVYKHQLFPKSITSLKNWLTPILNYFQNRTTNGAAEGVNNKIKLVLRRAFGFRNYHNMRLRILAAFH